MKKSRHIIEMYKKIYYGDKVGVQDNYRVLHIPPEVYNLLRYVGIKADCTSSAIRLGLLLKKLIPFHVLNLTLDTILSLFDILFLEGEGRENILEGVEIIRSKEEKEIEDSAFMPKDISIEMIENTLKNANSFFRETIQKEKNFIQEKLDAKD